VLFSSRNDLKAAWRRKVRPPHRFSQGGFTLLEVLISVAILSAIAFMVYRISTKSFQIRQKVGDDGDFHNGIRMALGVLERDVSLLYTPMVQVPEPARPGPAQQSAPGGASLAGGGPGGGASYETPSAEMAGPANPFDLIRPMTPEEVAEAMGADAGRVSSRFWLEAIHRSGIRPSRFQGFETKMSFVTVSHIRMYKEALESDFARVEYLLEDDRSAGAEPGTRVLIKKVTPNAFEDEEGGLNVRQKLWRTYPLLSGIRDLTFRYYRKERNEWRTTWDSDALDSKYRYPDVVEVELRVLGPSRLSFEGKFQMRPETFPRGVPPSG
jgi:prepilin-type N-terminal cleavage/methylation domain-containing protein